MKTNLPGFVEKMPSKHEADVMDIMIKCSKCGKENKPISKIVSETSLFTELHFKMLRKKSDYADS